MVDVVRSWSMWAKFRPSLAKFPPTNQLFDLDAFFTFGHHTELRTYLAAGRELHGAPRADPRHGTSTSPWPGPRWAALRRPIRAVHSPAAQPGGSLRRLRQSGEARLCKNCRRQRPGASRVGEGARICRKEGTPRRAGSHASRRWARQTAWVGVVGPVRRLRLPILPMGGPEGQRQWRR